MGEIIDDGLPKYAYDLVKMLDESVTRPEVPQTAAQMGHLADPAGLVQWAYSLGARQLVDTLVECLEEEEDRRADVPEGPDTGGVPDRSWGGLGDVYGSNGDVRPIVSSAGARVDEDGT